MTVPASAEAATRTELARLAEKDAALAESVLAASALELARQLDSTRNSATSKAMCARELRETMNRLAELAPVETEGNPLDEIRARRDAQLAAGGHAPADRVGPRRRATS